MSYDISVYKIIDNLTDDEISTILNGAGDVEPDEYKWAEISDIEVNTIIAKYENTDGTYGGGPISIVIEDGFVSLNMPYWADSRDKLQVMVKISEELAAGIHGFIWDPQLGKVVKGNEFVSQLEIFDKMTGVVQNQYKELTQPPKPWWKVW